MDVIVNAIKPSSPPGVEALTTQHDFWLNCLVQLGQDPLYTPLAELFRQQLNLEAGDWYIISPIHWEVTHNDAMISAYGDALNLSESLSRIWFEELSQFLAQDGFVLIYYSPAHWLMKVTNHTLVPALKSPNLKDMEHQSMMPVLATLDPTLYWQRLLTELQMF
jgi:hypothetical protein